jgi:hypothetical protein
VGEQKALVQTLHNSEADCIKNKDKIIVLFNETKYGVVFLPFVLETIKCTHKNLAYSLRQQFQSSKTVYETVIMNPEQTLYLTNETMAYSFSIWDRLANCSTSLDLYSDVNSMYIKPMLARFSYFSPCMSWLIYLALLLFVGETYSNDNYKLVYKHLIRDIRKGGNELKKYLDIYLRLSVEESTQSKLFATEMLAWGIKTSRKTIH